MQNDENDLGAQSATEDVSAGSIAPDTASHAAPNLPAEVQQVVDRVTTERRRYVDAFEQVRR